MTFNVQNRIGAERGPATDAATFERHNPAQTRRTLRGDLNHAQARVSARGWF